jgi:hypothetical protein
MPPGITSQTLYIIAISMKKIIFYITILFAGCTGRSSGDMVVASFDSLRFPYTINLEKGLENSGAVFLLSSVADSIRFVKLEKGEDCVFDFIYNVEVDSNNMFFYSPAGQKRSAIFRFNTEGMYINSIGRLGRGPGEYAGCSFSIDYETKALLILRWHIFQDLIIYDYDGNYKGHHPIGKLERSNSIMALTGGRVISYHNSWWDPAVMTEKDGQMFQMFDSTGIKRDAILHPILKLKDRENYKSHSLFLSDNSKGLYRYGDEAYMHSRWNDTIFVSSGYELRPAFILKKGKYQAPFPERYGKVYFTDYPYLGEYITSELLLSGSRFYIEQNLGENKIVFEYDMVNGNVRSSRVMASGKHPVGYVEYEKSPWFIDDLSGSGAGIKVSDRTERDGSVVAIPHSVSYFRERFGARQLPEGVEFRQSMLDERLNILDELKDDDNPVIVLIFLKRTM